MNKKIEELAKQLLSEIENENQKSSQKIVRGNTVSVADTDWIILKVEDDKVYCLHKEFIGDRQFDNSCNDWRESKLRKYLNSGFYNKLAEKVGAENIRLIKTDLMSLDGQREYGQSEDYVSLLTVNLYRENRDIIPNTGEWWWLATPWSTKSNDCERLICVVSPSGIISNYDCGYYIRVRPFCIFDSSIF